MKVLHVINSLDIGGAERLVVDLSVLMNDLGYETDVLLLNMKDTSFKRYLNNKSIHVYSLGGDNIYNPLLIFKIIKYIRRYDIIHSHLFPTQYWVAVAKLLSFSKTKLITTEHNTDNRRRHLYLFKWIDIAIYQIYSRIISISPQTTDALCSYIGECNNRIVTIENGIDVRRFNEASAVSRTLLVRENDPLFIIIQVAAFRVQKDQDTLIRAMTHLPKDYHLVLVGDGERKEYCIKLASDINVIDRVHFLGICDNIPNLLKTADVVVLSSHWEGFGLAAVEGMAAGKPVIVSDVPGLSNVVSGAGLLFSKGNVAELSEHIMKLSKDKKYYEQISDKCYQKALVFDIKKMVRKYCDIYENTLL